MSRRYALPALLLIALTAISGCTKTITVEQQPYEPKMVLEGLLLPGTTPRIFLSSSVPFFTNDQTPSSLFVHGVQLAIDGPDGEDFLVEDSTYNRFYCRWEPFYSGVIPVRENQTYTMRLDRNGQHFEASAKTDVKAGSIESVDYVAEFVDIYGGHEGVIIDFNDIPGEADRYRFEMIRELDSRHETVDDREYSSTCLADGEKIHVRDLGRFVYFDGALDGAPVRFVVEPAYTHYQGDRATLYIQSLDRNVAEFYDRLDRQREANVNPFIEPVFLDSQIDGLIGVFGAINRSAPVEFVFPEDAAL